MSTVQRISIADLIAEAQADHDTSFAVSNSVNVAYYTAHNGDLPRAETYLAWAERHMNDAPRIMTKARGARDHDRRLPV